jgi:UDP-N-acetylglucosamine 2-epimerase (non-hydrolysing)
MILITFSTRPELIKVLPIINEFKRKNIKFKTLFTGQHVNLVDFKADFHLNMYDESNNRLNNIIINNLKIPEYIFDNVNYILVQGDTSSVTGLALNAFNRKIKIIHLEAGLRTYDNGNPFPEENNRRIVSAITDIHFCPTKLNKKNLIKERIIGEKYVVGNTVLDNIKPYLKDCKYENKILITLHRRENHHLIKEWFIAINNLAKQNKNFEFIFPIHPNPAIQEYKYLLTDVNVIDPLNHTQLIEVLIKTKLVITDSGGLQEETSFFNKKCLVCRKTTERSESLNKNSFLILNPIDLEETFNQHINTFNINFKSPFGDGNSSKKIAKIIKKIIENEN